MADYTVSVTAHGLVPAVLYVGTEGSAGKSILFDFSSDWDGFTKEIIFFDNRGNTIITPCVDNQEVPIPAELTMYGGPHKYTVRGFTLDSGLYIDDQLQVTGTITTTWTAGHNPRLEGRIIPSTLDLFLYQANQAILDDLAAAKASGEFDAKFGEITAEAETLNAGEPAEASVVASGPNGAKDIAFTFKIPAGDSGVWVSDSMSDPPSADQNLWVLTASGDNYLWIPDGLGEEDGKVYLTVSGEKIGSGVVLTGKNFTVLGHYNTLAALEAAVPHPAVGDAYGIGVETPYDIYLWDGHDWVDYGPIGASVVVDSTMSGTSTNPVQNRVVKAYVDAVAATIPTVPIALKNPYKLTAYGTEYDGSAAVTLTADAVIDNITKTSAKPVSTKAVYDYIEEVVGDVESAIASINAVIGGVSE